MVDFGKIEAPEPGIYEDVPEQEYHQWNLPRQSILSWFRDPDICELDVLYRILNPSSPTTQMQLGNMLEVAVDTPSLLGANVRKLPPEIKARRGAAWDTLRDENPAITFLPPSEYKKHEEQMAVVRAMANQVKVVAGNLMEGAKQQVSFVADLEFVGEFGEPVTHRVKGRLDHYKPGLILDLKSTAAGGPKSVGRSVWNFAYDIQAALYTDAMNALTGDAHKFLFVVCRTTEPYPVSIYNGHNTMEMAGGLLDIGRRSYQQYLEQLARCVATDTWRGYYNPIDPDDKILDIMLPPWAGQE